eukprot:scaffold245_cov32-Cyclotella_meneghiniana.AAC.1
MIGVIMIEIIYPTINQGWEHVPIVRLVGSIFSENQGCNMTYSAMCWYFCAQQLHISHYNSSSWAHLAHY